MRIANAADFDELHGVTRRGNRGVMQKERWARDYAANCDGPSRFLRRRIADDNVAARGDQGAADAVAFEDHHGFVGSIAFGYAA